MGWSYVFELFVCGVGLGAFVDAIERDGAGRIF
jgi:hypothetical protein